MISSTSVAVLASCLSAVYAHAIREAAPLTTPAPVMPRQAPQAFVGYYSTSGVSSWAVEQCLDSSLIPHGTFFTSGSYGACCASSCSSTAFATACSGPYAMYPNSPVSCSFTCNTDFVLATANDANPTLWIGCDDDGVQTNFYRNTPAAATTSSAPSATVTVPPVNSSPVPTPTPTPTPKKKSMAWIAGVVVGPLVLLAIIGSLIFVFCFKKKKNTNNQTPQAYQATPQMAAVGGQQPQQQQTYMQPPLGAEQRYSTPAPQYSNQPYQPTQSPPPGQQWAQTPSPGLLAVSPIGTYAPDKPLSTQNLAQQEQQYLDTKTPKSPVPTVSEIASPQTYGPPSGISEVPSPQTLPAQPAQPASQSNYGAQAGPVPSHLPPNHASELQ